MSSFAKRWFFASGAAIVPVQADSGIAMPAIIYALHGKLATDVYEYQWSEIGKSGGPIDGWFQPKSVQAADLIAALPGVVLLPSLTDPSAVGADLAKLLAHAGVAPNDNGYALVKKLCDFHHKTPGEHPHAGLRPELY